MELFACRQTRKLVQKGFSKTLLIMNLTTAFLFAICLSVNASGLTQEISISEKNVSLEKIFKEATRQTGYRFVYTGSQMKKSSQVNVTVQKVTIEQLLEVCFKDQPLSYTIIDKVVIIKEKKEPAPAIINTPPPNLLNGKITNQSGEPLSGASIKEKGTNNIAVSKEDGSFSIIVSKVNVTLIVSYIGYKTREIVTGNQTNLIVSLDQTNSNLNDIVVVGYGSSRRKDLTGAVASLGSKDVKDLAVTRVDQALLGKVAGVQVKPVSGEPGVSPQIRIRGIGSISAGVDPLYVVDGVPTGSLETLNPNDVESIDVLKDASATAIYGSRGSNGVIIINTKRGKAGKTNISFDTYTGWQKVSKVPVMMNAREQAKYFYDGILNRNLDAGNNVTGPPGSWVQPVPAIILDVLEGRNTTDQNALDALLVTAPQSQYQLTASGGTENVKFLLSGEYLNQDGIVLNSFFKRYSLRANIDARLSKRMSVKVNLNPSFTDKSSLPVTGNQGENSLGSAIAVSNFYPLLNPDGSYFIFAGLPAQADFFNPLAVAREYIANQKGMRVLGNIDAEYKILDNLTFRILLGASYFSNKGMTFKPQLSVFSNNPATGTDNASTVANWLTEYTLSYNKNVGNHHFSGLAGYTVQKERADENFLTSNKYPNNLVPSLSAVSGVITSGTSTVTQWSLLSYLARINYNFNNKYYITSSIRTDGSSRFGDQNKYGLFPSLALAWRISEEKFLKEVGFINQLKLRTSFGQTGNNNIGNYQQYATINYVGYPLGSTPIGGYAPARLPNPSLTWEKQKSFNIGVDGSFFDNRVSISIDHFESRNTDLLLNVNTPAITGFSNSLTNIGEVKNKGWEFVLSTENIKGKFEWNTNFNFSTYKNEVVKLGPYGDPIYSGNNVTMIGQPIGMFYGFLTNGIFKTQAELNNGPIFNPGAADRSRVGDVRFVDVSGPNGKPDGIINSYDNTIMGSPYPDFYYGIVNRISYRNLSLSVAVQGVSGNMIYENSRGSGNSTRARVRVAGYNNNYWMSEQNPGDGQTPRPNDAPTGGVRLPSQRYLDYGTYLRVNNITLGYTMPDKICNKLSLSSCRIYISANNLFTITKNTTYNPDVSTSNDPLSPGNESNDYPLPKSIIIGLNLSFK